MQTSTGPKLDRFHKLKQKFSNNHVCVAGNGPTLKLLKDKVAPLTATVNSGLPYFKEIGLGVDLFWVQDLRVMVEKLHLVRPYISDIPFIIYNDDISFFQNKSDDQFYPIRMLDYVGFSHNINIGIFHGYNAIFGLLQILAYLEVSKITLYGVGLNYSAQQPRFYQTQRSFDVDLHRASEQVSLMREALDKVSQNGIEIEIIGDSRLRNSTPSSLVL